MKYFFILIFLSTLTALVAGAHPSYSEGRKINESLAREFSSIYKVKKIEIDPFVETKVGEYTVARTAYFYTWAKGQFSEKNEEELVESLEPWIESIEEKYGAWCQNRGFVYSKHAEDYSPTELPGVNLVFKNRDTKEVHLHLMISVFHTTPETLAIESTSIFSRQKLIDQAGAINSEAAASPR